MLACHYLNVKLTICVFVCMCALQQAPDRLCCLVWHRCPFLMFTPSFSVHQSLLFSILSGPSSTIPSEWRIFPPSSRCNRPANWRPIQSFLSVCVWGTVCLNVYALMCMRIDDRRGVSVLQRETWDLRG